MTPGVDFIAEVERAIRELFPKPKMLIIGFPSNPTAMCVELDFFERVIALAKQHDILVVHDLAYADIVLRRRWNNRRPRSCRCPARATWRSNSSPCRRATTWPAGASASWSATASWCNALARIKSYHDYGTFTPIQVASIVALDGPQECVEEIRRTYQKRRDVMVKGLHDIGWMVENPKASMYIWAKIPEYYAKMGSHRVHQEAAGGGEDRGLARHRLRRVRRRPRAHRADRERAPPAPGAARHPRDVPEGRSAARSGVNALGGAA